MFLTVAEVVISNVSRGQRENEGERRGLRGNWGEISKAQDQTTVDMRSWFPCRRVLDFFQISQEFDCL